jgi:hypothetical protein
VHEPSLAPSAITHELSDRSVATLVLGGDFDLTGPGGAPFYTPDEQAHLADARLLLWALLVGGGIAVAGIAWRLRTPATRPTTWRAVSRGGASAALAVVVIGLAGLVAFEPLFELFHRIVFPGGNWAFDPRTSNLVALYPYPFWQLTAAALGVLIALLGFATWFSARRLARRTRP